MNPTENQKLRADAVFDQLLAAATEEFARQHMDHFVEMSRMINQCAQTRKQCEVFLELLQENDESALEALYVTCRMAQIGFMLVSGRMIGRQI